MYVGQEIPNAFSKTGWQKFIDVLKFGREKAPMPFLKPLVLTARPELPAFLAKPEREPMGLRQSVDDINRRLRLLEKEAGRL